MTWKSFLKFWPIAGCYSQENDFQDHSASVTYAFTVPTPLSSIKVVSSIFQFPGHWLSDGLDHWDHRTLERVCGMLGSLPSTFETAIENSSQPFSLGVVPFHFFFFLWQECRNSSLGLCGNKSLISKYSRLLNSKIPEYI